MLDLGRRGRALAEREKTLRRAEGTLQEFQQLRQLAQTDPLGFAERMAATVGLDRARLVEAWTVNGAGGKAALSAEERVARLEVERAADVAARTKADQDAAKSRDEAEADAAVAQHVTGLKSLAQGRATEFPLVLRRLESSAVAAFDLMVLHHGAGSSITHEAALRSVEDQLRADADADAQLLGYAKAAPAASGQPTSHGTPAAGAPNTSGIVNGVHAPAASAMAGAAPFETAHVIKSDEDIAREWRQMFSRAA